MELEVLTLERYQIRRRELIHEIAEKSINNKKYEKLIQTLKRTEECIFALEFEIERKKILFEKETTQKLHH